MNSTELETQVNAPIQTLGMSFYFDAGTVAKGEEHGLNVAEFYGIGRGGVLGDVDVAEVAEAFWFFHEQSVRNMYGGAAAKVAPMTAAEHHLEAAYEWAERTFAGIDESVLARYATATRKVIDAVPENTYALFDGYRRFAVPASTIRAAYLSTILLRELRGGVHIETTKAEGIDPSEACYSNSEFIFKLHGYSEADQPATTEGLAAKMERAEEATTAKMAGFLDVLSDDERDAVAAGVAAMSAALAAKAG